MQNLFEISHLIKEKNVYILGTDQESLLLFSVMLQNEVYVKGFVVDNIYKQNKLNIMNKPIYFIDELDNKNDIVVVSGERNYSHAEIIEKKGYVVLFDYNYSAYRGDSIIL